MPKRIAIVAILLMLLVLLSSCGSTDTKKGVIKGRISLDAQEDNSGITVMLFAGDKVPAEIRAANQQYSQLAFTAHDKHIFDHRSANALHIAMTNPAGDFIFPKAEYGKYIIAYYKEGWGFKYIFDVELNTAELDISAKSPQVLYPVIEVPTLITGQFTFENGRCYNAALDVVVLDTAVLVFNAGSVLMLSPGKKINVYGSISSPGAMARITSNDRIYTSTPGTVAYAQGLLLYGTTANVANFDLSYLSSAFQIRKNGTTLESFLIRDCESGIVVYQANNTNISRCMIINNTSTVGYAISNNSAQYLYISYTLFYNNHISVNNELTKDSQITNSAFYGGSKSVSNLWESTLLFRNNVIDTEGIALENSGRSNLEMNYNDIKAQVCVKTFHTNNWYNTSTYGWTKAAFNNLAGTQYNVESRALYYSSGSTYPLDFKQNYWNTTSSDAISASIIDAADLGNPGVDWVWSVVQYSPFRSSRVSTAGIQ